MAWAHPQFMPIVMQPGWAGAFNPTGGNQGNGTQTNAVTPPPPPGTVGTFDGNVGGEQADTADGSGAEHSGV
jgi:hypothetical protein